VTGLPPLTCPACQFTAAAEGFLGADDARGVVAQMAACPGPPALRKALLRYVALFAPTTRGLSWGRAEKLLAEVVGMIQAGRIERNGRVWPAPLDYWQEALDEILATPNLRRPLKSHGYLLEILAGLANKAEAAEERQVFERQAGHTPVGLSAAHQPFKPEPPARARNPQAAAKALAAAKTILRKKGV